MKRILTPIALAALAILATSLWSVRQDRATLSESEKLTLRDAAREVNELDIEDILKIGREAQAKGIKPAVIKGGGAPGDGDLAVLESVMARDGYKPNLAVRDGLREDFRDKVRVWSWARAEARPFAMRHAWIFPAELFPPRNLPVPVSALRAGESEAAQAADEVRGIGHFIASSRPDTTLYFDLDQPHKVEIKNGQPQNHPYAQSGYVSGGSLSIPDGVLLKDALERSRFPLAGRTIADVQANLAQALRNRAGGEAYSVTGTAASGALSITFGKGRSFVRFWPALDQGMSPGEASAAYIEDALQKEGYKLNAAVRAGLREDLRDKVRVWSWAKPEARAMATRHAWVFPSELLPARNLPVPVPVLDQGEAETPAAADEARGIVHYIATTRGRKTLYFDLDQPKVVEIKNGQPQNHPYAQAGYINRGSFSIPDELLLEDALERSQFPLGSKKIGDVKASLAAALKKREGAEPYAVTGSAFSGVLSVSFGANRLFGQFWPHNELAR